MALTTHPLQNGPVRTCVTQKTARQVATSTDQVDIGISKLRILKFCEIIIIQTSQTMEEELVHST